VLGGPWRILEGNSDVKEQTTVMLIVEYWKTAVPGRLKNDEIVHFFHIMKKVIYFFHNMKKVKYFFHNMKKVKYFFHNMKKVKYFFHNMKKVKYFFHNATFLRARRAFAPFAPAAFGEARQTTYLIETTAQRTRLTLGLK